VDPVLVPEKVVTVELSNDLMNGWIKKLFDDPCPDHCSQAEDLATKCHAVLSWIDDHVDAHVEVSKELAKYFCYHLIAIRQDAESRKDGLEDDVKMLVDSTISLLTSIYTCTEPWKGPPVHVEFSAHNTKRVWEEIMGDAKSTTINDFPFVEQDEASLHPEAESPAIKVKEKPSTKKATRKPRKAKETVEEKQARALAEVSDAVMDAHTWMGTLSMLEQSGGVNVKETIEEAEDIMLKLGKAAGNATALGVDWSHVILTEAEATFDELVVKIQELGLKMPALIKAKAPVKKRKDYPVKKKTKSTKTRK
jgi:hypothetical protein